MSEGYGYQGPQYGAPAGQSPVSPPPPGGGQTVAYGSKKKKRGYAAEAFDIGVGANAVPPPTHPQYGGLPDQFNGNAPVYGYGQSPASTSVVSEQTPGYGAAPAYGLPTGPAPGVAYNPPGVSYGAGSIDTLTNSMSQMNVSGAPGAGSSNIPHPQTQTTPLNQLYPVDIQQQPVKPWIIDFPPPPIIIPPNLAVTQSPYVNCPTKYMRSTLNAVPATSKLLSKSKLPFALVVQPYGALHDQDDPVPLVEDQIIARCRRCRTYINPFVTFMDQGHRWRCNMCNLTNDVPQAFDWDAATQKSVDRWQRHELNHAVMEFVAPQEYMVRPPQPLVYLFLIDVSYAAVASGLVTTVAQTILSSLDIIPNADQCTRLGFIAVDSSLHYFSIPTDQDNNEKGTDIKMMVVSDLDEPFMPVPESLLAHLSTSRGSIEKFLNSLPNMFKNSQSNSSCMGSAVVSGHKLISSLGGKLVVLTASLPNLGQGKLTAREDRSHLGTSKETALLQTGNNFYKSFAVECSKNQVSVDMFLFGSQYQDVASLSNLPRYTGGQTWYYPSWTSQREPDAVKFSSEFSKYLSSEIALEAVLRVRATTGLRMNAFYGNFFSRSSDLCAFPAMPRDQCYVIEVAIDETINKPSVYLQAAILHTTCNGERRIRILTLALPTTHNLADVYASADQVAITTFFTHKAVERALSGGLDAARDALQSKLIELLQTYRKELGGGSINAGMQFPANLHALPLLFLGLIKNVGFRQSKMLPSDLRSAALCLLSTLPPPLLTRYIYPKMYDLTQLPVGVGDYDESTGQIKMPQQVFKLGVSSLHEQGLFLIDDGQVQFLWVGQHLAPEWLESIFGVQDRNFLNVGSSTIPDLRNDLNERIRNIIDKSRDYRSVGCGSIIRPHLYIVRPEAKDSAPLTLWARTMLVEDASDQAPSVEQWISTLRGKVVT